MQKLFLNSRKLFLESNVAVIALMGLSLGLPASAHDRHDRPVVVPMSADFTQSSQVTARQTVQVVQTGSSSAGMDGEGDAQVWAQGTPVVDCPDGPTNSDNWHAIPADLRKIAVPGQCYSRLLIAPQVENFREHVLVAEAHTETRTVPEVSRMVDRDVVVQPEHTVRRLVPAVTHTEMVTEVITPASEHDERIPAQYETRTEHVMVKAARREWTRAPGIPTGAALVTPDDHQPVAYSRDGTLQWPGKDGYDSQSVPVDGQTADYLAQGSAQDIWCLNQTQGEYADRRTRVEVSPESVRHVVVPAVTRQVEHVVVDVPEHQIEEVVPAVVEHRQVREVVTPEHTESYEVPAVYRDVDRQRVVGQPKTVWREVLCSKNATPQVVMAIQRALAARGYQPGAIDGHLGSQTVSAMQKFQADSGLPQGQVSVEAVQALGIDLRHR
ncbi:peptidoglycan-binding domain-containing protein [Asticcacaulis sp. EMRT-3]|uniref:peptidoglycan-binding domain-containing protein n=1 Tax=Asticcacaulis sp. EMRT-3 TaxID=3040349 RepID=UPI0024AF8524|nr:peptidoglycan-binding domain-containing protein [Asticcacaulis sp. EMRT-3]MDI7774115.1 peptidoglycan-binding domain-containing protein [Asticcacaulis sp. EMRT-3]